ncbi:MAG: hypothetical protein A2664_00300 [Candidatus Taylorbacteria bacterium RIFCSPHIGHO2_01_FULL_46_22b]|uniref:Transmembrane protein n=1 Tax=Candidatus Taylorbacteria bacterium RIFCSPHIGHO2_01_FULL_46_22b TaxID=1802301 RepID=A0A1G2M428_9BACT|nr:MAG: hypothetical protein A2664_00300 [Candidatus Taylorbacteria bacterium RIFCSPHIGHO2_01_FULL_46_22b]
MNSQKSLPTEEAVTEDFPPKMGTSVGLGTLIWIDGIAIILCIASMCGAFSKQTAIISGIMTIILTFILLCWWIKGTGEAMINGVGGEGAVEDDDDIIPDSTPPSTVSGTLAAMKVIVETAPDDLLQNHRSSDITERDRRRHLQAGRPEMKDWGP